LHGEKYGVRELMAKRSDAAKGFYGFVAGIIDSIYAEATATIAGVVTIAR